MVVVATRLVVGLRYLEFRIRGLGMLLGGIGAIWWCYWLAVGLGGGGVVQL